MFTGIVEEIGCVESVDHVSGGKRVRIACSFADELGIDDSVAVNGICLTVVLKSQDWFECIAIEQTLGKTSLSEISEGSTVNLERAMLATGRLDGHVVQGHIDGVGRILEIRERGSSWEVSVELDADKRQYLIPQGSITLDGISLTVARLEASSFMVAIIPHTYHNTIVSTWHPAKKVNIEFDMIGKYVVGYMVEAGIGNVSMASESTGHESAGHESTGKTARDSEGAA